MQSTGQATEGIGLREVDSSDPRDHTPQIRTAFAVHSQHLRKDINEIEHPKAQTLFETAAEVLEGLDKAFDHFERSEPAFK